MKQLQERRGTQKKKQEGRKEDVAEAVYLPRTMKKGKPGDGSHPSALVAVERRVSLPVLERTKALEQRLRAANYKDPQGNPVIWRANNEKWKQILLPLLVDKATAILVAGQGWQGQCSEDCFSEKGNLAT